jgi:tRNA G18 (ribose-2'-O)-methylase SpoU
MKNFPIKVLLEDIRSAFNVGSIFRTSDAAGIEELILTGITPYPPHNRIPKTALGATESVKWQYIPDKIKAAEYCDKTTEIIGVEITDDAVSYFDWDFTKPTTLVFGNEISGISVEMLSKCKKIVKIPMYGTKHSLNIATSYGIVVYEIVRQWTTSRNSHEIS